MEKGGHARPPSDGCDSDENQSQLMEGCSEVEATANLEFLQLEGTSCNFKPKFKLKWDVPSFFDAVVCLGITHTH